MRFRLGQDERLYETLRAEIYLRLLPSLPKTALIEVMRNMQKLEALAYGEGIKQGMAVAASSADAEVMLPIVAHADFYGDAQTPLVRVEEERLPKKRANHPWLTALPVEFPPQTIAEALAAYGPSLDPADAPRERTTKPQRRVAPIATPEEDDFGLSEGTPLQIGPPLDVRDLHEQEVIDREIAAGEQEAEARGEDRAQSPDLLDRIRTQIKAEMNNGWDPKTWPDVIMHLMLSMHIDAAFLDLQLGGEQGRAVLDQCGLHHIFPGAGVVVGPSGEFAGVKT